RQVPLARPRRRLAMEAFVCFPWFLGCSYILDRRPALPEAASPRSPDPSTAMREARLLEARLKQPPVPSFDKGCTMTPAAWQSPRALKLAFLVWAVSPEDPRSKPDSLRRNIPTFSRWRILSIA